MKRNDFIKYLSEHGCILKRHGSKHDVYTNKRTGKFSTVPRHAEVKKNTGKAICKQLGIPIPASLN